jgi:hypothetical protein
MLWLLNGQPVKAELKTLSCELPHRHVPSTNPGVNPVSSGVHSFGSFLPFRCRIFENKNYKSKLKKKVT